AEIDSSTVSAGLAGEATLTGVPLSGTSIVPPGVTTDTLAGVQLTFAPPLTPLAVATSFGADSTLTVSWPPRRSTFAVEPPALLRTAELPFGLPVRTRPVFSQAEMVPGTDSTGVAPGASWTPATSD